MDFVTVADEICYNRNMRSEEQTTNHEENKLRYLTIAQYDTGEVSKVYDEYLIDGVEAFELFSQDDIGTPRRSTRMQVKLIRLEDNEVVLRHPLPEVESTDDYLNGQCIL